MPLLPTPRPAPSRAPRHWYGRGAGACLLAGLVLAWAVPSPLVAGPPERPVALRLSWGGGRPRVWAGTIAIEPAPAAGLVWQTTCTDADASGSVHAAGHTIFVHDARPRGGNGVEVLIPRWRDARIAVRLWADGDEKAAVSYSAAVADLLLDPAQQILDRDGNRLALKAAPGEFLRVTPVTAAGRATGAALFRPGDTVRLAVDPLLPKRISGTVAIELRLRFKGAGEGDPQAAQSLLLAEVPGAPGVESRLQEYERVFFDVTLPNREGGHDVELEAVERGGLRWSRPLAVRTVQVAAVAENVEPLADGGEWRVIHELDPGSPRLHERLRRLPGMAMPHVPVPSVPIPSMTLPKVGLPAVPVPNVSLPKLPAVPMPNVSLPNMSLPNVASMVPRLGGLLAAGHSTVEAHPLGPMLRLPPARSADEPSWEGIVIASALPGQPHVVEVDFPRDQEAVVALSVLESDPSGAVVETRAGGGFEVSPPAAGEGEAGLGRHAFVFWPTTRHPLLVIANPAVRSPAVFGRVRVSAGPRRPAPVSNPNAAAAGPLGVATPRRVHAFLPQPDFTPFGGGLRPAVGAGRPLADWNTHVAGAAHAAEWLAAEGAAGTMAVVYRHGAAIWPSRLTAGAPRWDPAATSDVGLDPDRKDLLALLCRVHHRENLRLIPALCFDAPLPALESLRAVGGDAAAGIACVGRDGRARQLGGGCHYNVLDPRVQGAVEELVREAAGRLRGSPAVDGMAIVLSHDGWMHLPGTAWALDDATFSRFLAEAVPEAAGEAPAGEGRFARRAALVEGPLKERWLAWRAAAVARFQSRLAGALAEHDPRWSLHVVPTTLFSEGDLAARFRPVLAADAADSDVLREAGLDPALITADGRIVFVSPHVHAAAGTLLERGTVEHANRSLGVARGVATAARRGVIILEQPLPLSVDAIVPHGPFGSAAVDGPVQIHAIPAGASRGRALAESLVAADAETIFDMRLALCRLEPGQRRCLDAFAAVGAGGCVLAETLSAPLVVRSRADGGRTVVSIANAGPAPCRALVAPTGSPSAVVDAVDRTRLPFDPGGGASVPLGPWEVRTLLLDGGPGVQGARVEFDAAVRDTIEKRLADLVRRRAVLDTPRPLDVLDNPGFELAGPAGADVGGAPREQGGGVGGWELLEPRRGALAYVSGVDGPGGRGLAFSSVNGLSTLRSNPFPPPAAGRVSVAVWLRIDAGGPQPPLRLALEGVQDGREYYRFAPVGGLAGGKPLSSSWSQYVLQVDELPARGLESLRVRFDLLGPGAVQLDGVRVFDLAFDESQRSQLTRRLSLLEQRLAVGDLGTCLVELDSYWPRFLSTFVSDAALAAAAQSNAPHEPGPARAATPPAERSGSVFDRLRRWWQ
jgi:hypothetical protein